MRKRLQSLSSRFFYVVGRLFTRAQRPRVAVRLFRVAVGLDPGLCAKYAMIISTHEVNGVHVSVRFLCDSLLQTFFAVRKGYVWRGESLTSRRNSPEALLGCDGQWRASSWNEEEADGGFIHEIVCRSDRIRVVNVEGTMLLGARSVERPTPDEMIVGFAREWLGGNHCNPRKALARLQNRGYLPPGRCQRLLDSV